MPTPKELEKLGGLFEKATSRSQSFLDRCTETKYMAISNYSKAEDEYITMARGVLEVSKKRRAAQKKCEQQLATVKSALESGQLGSEYVTALQELRQSFFNGVLQPAVKAYLNRQAPKDEVESLYERAICIDGLLEVIQFLEKIQKS